MALLFLTVDECMGVSLSKQSCSVSIARVTVKFSADWLKLTRAFISTTFPLVFGA